MIEEVISFVREKLKTSHMLDFTIVAIDERGHKHLLDANPQSLSSDEANELADALRDELRQKDIIRYAFISECWVSRIAPMPTGPVTREYVDRHLATYHNDYQERGLSPRKGGGRRGSHPAACVRSHEIANTPLEHHSRSCERVYHQARAGAR